MNELGFGLDTTSASIIPIILWVVIPLVVIIVALMITRYLVHHINRIPRSMEYVVLLVLLPRETMRQEMQNKDWREILAAFETLFLTLGGIKLERGSALKKAWQRFWFSRHDHLALEMVAYKGQIHFYLAVPREVRQLVELQIQAQYPQAQIEEAEDYNIFSPASHIRGAMLRLTKPYFFPIRTYRKLDSDPLNAITNVLSKVQAQEGAAIQVLIRPKSGDWNAQGRRIAHQMQHGKSLKEAVGKSSGGNFLTASLKSSDDRYQPAQTPYVTPMEQELIRTLEEKAGKPGFDANLRIVTASPLAANAGVHLENIVNAFTQFTAPESGNHFKRTTVVSHGPLFTDFIFRHFSEDDRLVLTSEEVNSLYHFPLPQTETPNILWLGAKQAAAPVNLPADGIILGHNVYRGQDTDIRIKTVDRRRHVYIIGTTGVGKSWLQANMAIQDIKNGDGVCIVDPHGSFVEDVLPHIPPERMHDVVIFDPSDTERPMGLNMLEAHTPEERDFAVQEMIAIFMKLFPPEMIGPVFEHNMRNAMLTLMEDEDSPGTIADIPRIFTDKAFQQYKLTKVKDPVVRAFWEKEVAKTTDFHKSETMGYLVSKVGRFVENAMMRNIIGQPKSGFNLREIMDQKKILLVNLCKGKVGEVNAELLGLIIVSKLQMAALSRADMSEAKRADFYLYIDEFQNYVTDSIATILSEARKYKLNMTMGHQYMGQLIRGNDTKVRDAVLGNVGTMVAFRIGVDDAEILEKQFAPTFSAFDLVNQQRFTAYIRLLIDNTAAPPFHMQTYPITPGNPQVAAAVKQYSRLRYGKDRRVVEAEIYERTKLGESVTPVTTVGSSPTLPPSAPLRQMSPTPVQAPVSAPLKPPPFTPPAAPSVKP